MAAVLLILLIVLLAVAAGCAAGAVSARWFLRRQLGELRFAGATAYRHAERADTAVSRFPAIIEQVDGLARQVADADSRARGVYVASREAKRRADEVAARQAQLEYAVAANFGITLVGEAG